MLRIINPEFFNKRRSCCALCDCELVIVNSGPFLAFCGDHSLLLLPLVLRLAELSCLAQFSLRDVAYHKPRVFQQTQILLRSV